MRRNRVLLPGVSVLARQVSEVHTIAEGRLHATVARAAHRADPHLPADLVATLCVPEGDRYSDRSRRSEVWGSVVAARVPHRFLSLA
ncbi:hypothetical protein OHU74_16755 [Streptomyces sp. NBC_00454]